ncbi:MAG TPA: sugar ABC transporter permease [Microbacterium sp.]|uniref:sugar ABC transporter permease n=1 Tax=Microbacterium sp. TaxID=51671 RepID=UPI002B459662|nr:sugar ABC transporter permease [Microbacterium sp.]HKT56792.1 sugar ABC transporter permease [Microbacterium sp.]
MTDTQHTKIQREVATGTLSQTAADLQDERLIRNEGLGGAVQSFFGRVRRGDLGQLPVIIGLIVIWAIFTVLNPTFLSADNLSNLVQEMTPTGIIALGIVLVLLLGQIDLSVGSVSGLASAVVGVLAVQVGMPYLVAILIAMAVGVLIGLLYGFLFIRFGVPSFVITLAGLLGFLGIQVWILGANGSINIPFQSWFTQFAFAWFLPPWVAYLLAALAGGSILYGDLMRARRRHAAGLSTTALSITLVKAISLAVVLAFVAWYFSTSRGTGVMFTLFVVLVVLFDYLLIRTRWGRSIYAVGGNVEAARRAGIRVNWVFISVFMLCSFLAATGGILQTAYGQSANLQSGTGDVNLDAIAAAVIGGTSLFGGRGRAWSALLGIIVIFSITSGLNLLNLNSAARYVITAIVLLLAVIVDSLSRRSRAAHGQA